MDTCAVLDYDLERSIVLLVVWHLNLVGHLETPEREAAQWRIGLPRGSITALAIQKSVPHQISRISGSKASDGRVKWNPSL